MDHHVRDQVEGLAFAQDGMLSRRQLLAAGMTRWEIVAELRAQRWTAHGTQSICTHTGIPSAAAMRWFAMFEAGPRSALDGISALQAAGLKNFDTDVMRVSVPRGARVVRRPGVTIRQTRRLQSSDVIEVGVRRVRPEVAAVRAALWAVSERQGATIVAMTVQQRIARPEAIAEAFLTVRRHRRKKFFDSVIHDLLDGAQAMGELDFAALCRRHGLPEPDRQAVRRTSTGKAYLDVYWSQYRLVVEVDGIHHLAAPAVVGDALRQNEISLASDTVLWLPLLGLRVAPEDFMRQVRQGLVAGGWNRAA